MLKSEPMSALCALALGTCVAFAVAFLLSTAEIGDTRLPEPEAARWASADDIGALTSRVRDAEDDLDVTSGGILMLQAEAAAQRLQLARALDELAEARAAIEALKVKTAPARTRRKAVPDPPASSHIRLQF